MQILTPYNRPDYNDLPPQFPPDCASAWGEDQYGVWFDLSLKQVVQRFRWIPKGQFTMGSPESEKERESHDLLGKEALREVSFTHGYWLADTACTQAPWQLMLGNNPAIFSSDGQNPAEQVSWLDIQKFLAKMNQAIPNLKAQLPTEAQWEYACRAGTVTPFSWGENMTPELVNYNGNHPYEDGKKGEYREKTIPVQGLAANQWGLYQMHGNVWEWCFDEFHQALGHEPVTNPIAAHFKAGFKPDKADSKDGSVAEQTSSREQSTKVYSSEMLENADDAKIPRVLRGGSWDDGGGGCRSAARSRLDAGLRSDLVGFRLALGL